jgi:hypothetical protein
MSEEEESKRMRTFFKEHEKEMGTYGQLKGLDASEAYLLEHPYLASEFTANWLTIECLNYGMEFKVCSVYLLQYA